MFLLFYILTLGSLSLKQVKLAVDGERNHDKKNNKTVIVQNKINSLNENKNNKKQKEHENVNISDRSTYFFFHLATVCLSIHGQYRSTVTKFLFSQILLSVQGFRQTEGKEASDGTHRMSVHKGFCQSSLLETPASRSSNYCQGISSRMEQ